MSFLPGYARRPAPWVWMLMLLALCAGPPFPAAAEINSTLSYQGYLTDASGEEIDGTRTIVFSIYDVFSGGTALWTQPKSVTIADGSYSVVLGDTTPLQLDKETEYWLGVNVENDGEMSPRIPISAGMLSLLPNLGQQTVLVAKTGGDHATITDALTAITDAATDKRYLIKVGPGVYAERITMKSWVSIQGSGRDITFIKGQGYDTTGTILGVVIGADDCTLSHLTVADEAASARDTATGISLDGASPYIHDLNVLAQGATSSTIGVWAENSSSPTLRRVQVTASGDAAVVGIYTFTGCEPELEQVQASAADGDDTNIGVYITEGCSLEARDCTFSASGEDLATVVGLLTASSDAICQQSTFAASGGYMTRGFYGAGQAEIELRRCRATAQGGTALTCGMQLQTSAGNPMEVELSKSQATASASNATSEMLGIFATTGDGTERNITLSMDTVTAQATGGSYAAGLGLMKLIAVGQNVWAAGLEAANLCYGMILNNSEVTLVNSAAQADGGESPPDALSVLGVDCDDTRAQLLNCTIVADHKGASGDSFGVDHKGDEADRSLELVNCSVSGETNGVLVETDSDFSAGATQISSGFNRASGTGTDICRNCFTGAMGAVNSDCTTP